MWQTPKTDWEIKPYVNGIYQGDWFNIEDYNRIIENIRYLHAAGQNVYANVFAILGMSPAVRNAFPRASEINTLENALYALIQNTYSPPSYTGKKTWVGGSATLTFEDLNRIEQACLSLYNKYNETALKRYVPSDATSLVTSDGSTFMTR